VIGRLEVTSGPGVVIRYGNVAAWTTPDASPALHAFLIESARNLAGSPEAGQVLVDHLVSVLGAGDPEPQVAFAVVGPGRAGLVGLLHGPAQAWDGESWTVTPAQPGWARIACNPSPALFVNRAGDVSPEAVPSSVLDLEAGVVPGAGFILWPGDASEDELQAADLDDGANLAASANLEDPTLVDATLVDATLVAAAPEADEATQIMASLLTRDPEDAGRLGETGETGEATRSGHTWVFDLRSGPSPARRRGGSPLPAVGSPFLVDGKQVLVDGVRCHRGHLNRPGMIFCAVCSSPIRDGEEPPTLGPRPPLGCLVTSDGSVYRLDCDYRVGPPSQVAPKAPGGGEADPLGAQRPLDFGGDPELQGRAEVILEGWDVVVLDGGSEVGTYLYRPGASKWQRMANGSRAVLEPGSHISFGRNVVTYINPWVAATSADTGEGLAR
jgi:hypothetical protein